MADLNAFARDVLIPRLRREEMLRSFREAVLREQLIIKMGEPAGAGLLRFHCPGLVGALFNIRLSDGSIRNG